MGGVFYFMKKKSKRCKGTKEKEKFLQELGKERASALTERATPPELEFKLALDSAGVEYEFQKPVVCERNYLFIVDFYLPKYKLIFELDGWQHETREGRKSDRQRTRRLEKLGYSVKRIKNFNVHYFTPEFIKSYLLGKATTE